MPPAFSRHSMDLVAHLLLAFATLFVLQACDAVTALPPIKVASCAVTPGAPTVQVADTLLLSAQPIDAAGDRVRDVTVSWRSDAPAVATVDATRGVVRGVSVGSVQLTAVCGSRSASVLVKVTPRPVVRVELSPSAISMTELDTTRITATAYDDLGVAPPGNRITWVISDATVATIDTTGRVIGAAPGTATIAAAAGTVTATAAVRVAARPVATVTMATASVVLPRFDAQPLSVMVRDATGRVLPGRIPAWSSSAPGVATVSPAGVVTAVSVGTSTITATVEGRSASTTVTVIPPATVVRIDLTPSSAFVITGRTLAMFATPRDSTGRALQNRTVQWNTSAAAVATVSAGTVTAVSPGVVVISATVDGVSSGATLTVLPVPVATLTIAPTMPAVRIGRTVTLNVTPRDSAGGAIAGRTVTWMSLTPTVATVSSTGVVTGLAEGSGTVRAEVDEVSATVSVQVTAPTVASVQITPSSPLAPIGGTVNLQAVAVDSAGIALPGRPFAWSTANSTVATVSASGVVTGIAAGSATITATTGGKTAQTSVTVRAVGAPTKVQLSPSRLYLMPGQAQTLTPLVTDASGFVVTGRTVSWSTADATVATVSSTGAVRAVAVGMVRVTAIVDGNTATADVLVVPTFGQPVARVWSAVVDQANMNVRTTCALTVDGSAFCWGYNYFGDVGDGTTTRRFDPVRVAGNIAFRIVQPGGKHTCGLSTMNVLYCWGDNTDGELGDGTTVNRRTPTVVSGGRTYTHVAVGTAHTCALDTAGQAWCWGSNRAGQLGVGSNVSSSSVPLPVATTARFESMTAHYAGWISDHNGSATCGLTNTRTLVCWGEPLPDGLPQIRYTPAEITIPVPFRQFVDAGTPTSVFFRGSTNYCGLDDAGVTWCALGRSSTSIEYNGWQQALAGPSVSLLPPAGLCALSASGTVRCWTASALTSTVSLLSDQPPLVDGSATPGGRVFGIDANGRLWRWAWFSDGPYLVVIPP